MTCQSAKQQRATVFFFLTTEKCQGFFLEMVYHIYCKNGNFSNRTLSECYANLLIYYKISHQCFVPGKGSEVV